MIKYIRGERRRKTWYGARTPEPGNARAAPYQDSLLEFEKIAARYPVFKVTTIG